MPTPPTQTGPVLLSQCPVSYAILRESPLTIQGEFGTSGGGWSGTLDFVVDSKDIYAFCQFAGGSQYTVGSATRYIPLSHPDAPTLLCTKIKAVAKGGYTDPNLPVGQTVALSNWSKGFISLTFTSVPWPMDGSAPMMTTETRAGSEVYTLAGSKLKFPSDGTIIQADAGITVPTTVYTLTIYLAVSLDDSALNALLGNVNNATFLGNPAGTIRFDGFNSQSTMTGSGQQAYTRTLMLTYRPVPWIQFLRPNGVWEAAVKPDSSYVYTASDLSPLTA